MLISFYHLLCAATSKQQALLSVIERWKNTLHQNGHGCAKLMELSKAFMDTINHYLLIAKLCAYSFDSASLKLIGTYLTNSF